MNLFLKGKHQNLVNEMKVLHNKPMLNILNRPSITDISNTYKMDVMNLCTMMDAIEQKCNLKNVCSKGCNSCCKQYINISAPEYLIIKRYVDSLDYVHKKELKERCSQIINKMKESGIPLDSNSFCDDVNPLSQKYFEMNCLCPFNSSDGECEIYDIRPMVCWQYRHYGKVGDCSKYCNPRYSLPPQLNECLILSLQSMSSSFIKGNEESFLPSAILKMCGSR